MNREAPAWHGRHRRRHRWHGAEAPGPGFPLPAAGPSPSRTINACLSQPPTKTGSAGTRSFTFLRLSSSNCSPQGDAIRPHHPHSSLPWPCQAPTPTMEARGPGPFCRAQTRASRPPDTQKDLGPNLVFQGKSRGLSKAMVGVELATAPSKCLQPAE